MRLLTLLLACSDPTIPLGKDTPGADAASELTCADGEIRLASTGATYPTLSDALDASSTVDHVCVGAGTFPALNAAACAERRSVLDWRDLTIMGAGSDRTRLVGEGDACAELFIDADEPAHRRALSGVTLWNAPTLILDGDVMLTDVRVAGYAGGNRALRVKTHGLDVRALTIADNVVDYAGGFELYGDGTIEGLVVEGNRSEEGYVGEISGVIDWYGGHVSDNTRTSDIPGYDFLETWGSVTIANVGFFDNRVNGPMLTTYGALSLDDVSFVGNDTNYRGVLSSFGTLAVNGGVIRGNHGADGIVALYGEGHAALSEVAMADNDGCAVAGEGACLVEEASATTSLTCDISACE